MKPPTDARRRTVLLGAAALAFGPPGLLRAAEHEGPGPVDPPRPVPLVELRDADGRGQSLASLLLSRVSAVQLMFTGCSSVCPVQGAIFAAVQQALAARPVPGAQLVSISIDPLADTPAALQAWRRRYGAGADWRAVVPAAAALDRLVASLSGAAVGSLELHALSVFFFDAQARLRWRSGELASAGEIVRTLAAVAGLPSTG